MKMMLEKTTAIIEMMKNSLIYRFLKNAEKKYDFFSSSRIINLLIIPLIFSLNKLYIFQRIIDKTIMFGLRNPMKKCQLMIILLTILNPFIRNNHLGSISAIPLTIIFFIALINSIYYFENCNKKLVSYIFATAFIVKLMFLVAISNIVLFPDEYLGYHDFSSRIANSLSTKSDIDVPAVGDSGLYYYVLGGVYYVFGNQFLIGRLFNLFTHILTGGVIYLLTKNLFENKTATIATILFFSSISINIFSIALLREGLLLFFVVLIFLSFNRLEMKINNIYSPLFILAIIYLLNLTYRIRSYFIDIIKISLILSIVFFLKKIYSKMEYKKFYDILMLAAIIFFIGMTASNMQDPLNKLIGNFNEKIGMFDNYRNELDYGSTKFYEGIDTSTPSKAFRYLPIGITYAILSPFPTHITNFNMLIIFFGETIPWYGLIIFIIIGTAYAIKNHFTESIPILGYSTILLIVLSLLEGNVGNLLRHSIHFKAFLLIFAAHGIAKTCPEGFLKKIISPNINNMIKNSNVRRDI